MKIILFLILFVIFYSASAGRTEGNEYLLNVVNLCLFGLFVLVLFLEKFRIKNNLKYMLAVYLYIILSGLSAIINNDSVILRNAFLIGLVFIIAYNLLPLLKYNINKIIFIVMLISHISLVFIPLIQFGIDQTPYQGIFYNPNTFGNTVVTIFALIFPLLIMILEKRIEGKRQRFFYLKLITTTVSLIILVYLVSVSSSRVSFIAMVTMIVVGFIILCYYIYINNKILLLLKRGLFYVGIPILALVISWNTTNISSIVQDSIFSKFESKIGEGDVLDKRGEIWLHTLNEAKPFGHGSDYFTETFNLGAHNTFVHILGINGYLPAILLIAIIVSILWMTFKYTLIPSNNVFKYSPFILSLNFLMLSLGENMLLKSAMLLMLYSVSDIYREKIVYKTNKSNRVLTNHAEANLKTTYKI